MTTRCVEIVRPAEGFDAQEVLKAAQSLVDEGWGSHLTAELEGITIERTTMRCHFVVVDPLDEYSTREEV